MNLSHNLCILFIVHNDGDDDMGGGISPTPPEVIMEDDEPVDPSLNVTGALTFLYSLVT